MPMLIGDMCERVGYVGAAAFAPFALLEVKFGLGRGGVSKFKLHLVNLSPARYSYQLLIMHARQNASNSWNPYHAENSQRSTVGTT